MLQPIALEEQARELLKAGDFDQALQLADVAAAEGASWVEDAYAEAAFLLIHGNALAAPCPFSELWQGRPIVISSFDSLFGRLLCSCL